MKTKIYNFSTVLDVLGIAALIVSALLLGATTFVRDDATIALCLNTFFPVFTNGVLLFGLARVIQLLTLVDFSKNYDRRRETNPLRVEVDNVTPLSREAHHQRQIQDDTPERIEPTRIRA